MSNFVPQSCSNHTIVTPSTLRSMTGCSEHLEVMSHLPACAMCLPRELPTQHISSAGRVGNRKIYKEKTSFLQEMSLKFKVLCLFSGRIAQIWAFIKPPLSAQQSRPQTSPRRNLPRAARHRKMGDTASPRFQGTCFFQLATQKTIVIRRFQKCLLWDDSHRT